MSDTLQAQCQRPRCRGLFTTSLNRGRPRRYCNDECRRLADTEYKQALSVVDHFERLLDTARKDLACFGRGDEPTDDDPSERTE